jgi:hypothetical protein
LGISREAVEVRKQMKMFAIVLIALIATVAPTPCIAQSVGGGLVPGFEQNYGLPTRLKMKSNDFNDFIDRRDLTPLQQTEVLTQWLVSERRWPTERYIAPGGPIDSDYVLTQIVGALGVHGDPAAIKWLIENVRIQDAAVLDALRLALAGHGDERQIPALRRILTTDENPYFRARAARRLGELGDIGSKALLKNALKDVFSVQAGTCVEDSGPFYPVRQEAKEALMRLDSVVYMQRAQTRKAKFKATVLAAVPFVTQNRTTLARLARIVASVGG